MRAASICLACLLASGCAKDPAPKSDSPDERKPAASSTAPAERESEPSRVTEAPTAPKTQPTSKARMLTQPKITEDGKELFGQELQGATKVALGELLAKPTDFEDKPLTVEGTARRVCSRKGCWMELAQSDAADAASCRVKFKDYAFFVPTDSAGATVTVEGSVKITTVKPGRVRHLEREGAVFASKNADGSANEVQLVATGVEMVRKPRP